MRVFLPRKKIDPRIDRMVMPFHQHIRKTGFGIKGDNLLEESLLMISLSNVLYTYDQSNQFTVNGDLGDPPGERNVSQDLGSQLKTMDHWKAVLLKKTSLTSREGNKIWWVITQRKGFSSPFPLPEGGTREMV